MGLYGLQIRYTGYEEDKNPCPDENHTPFIQTVAHRETLDNDKRKLLLVVGQKNATQMLEVDWFALSKQASKQKMNI